MPRLLGKLIKRIKDFKHDHVLKSPEISSLTSRRARRIIPKALPPPSFSPQHRKESILLDEFNPIMNRDAFVQHKNDGPTVPTVAGRGKHANTTRQVTEMTDHECQLWSDPYLRMLGSPLRQCLVSQKHLPADFMVRLAVLRVTGSRLSKPILVLLPDGVEHPRFRRRNSGRGVYLTLHNIFINEMTSRGAYKRIPGPKLQIHSLLAAQIGHQLRLRVLQELELLRETLRCAPQTALEATVIRRLTRTEWLEIEKSGRISQPGAVAVLVVPPIDKRKKFNENKKSDEQPPPPLPELPPLSVLYGTPAANYDDSLNSTMPVSQVPLYNGLTLFPSRPMRSKLFKTLQNALQVERQARWRQSFSSENEEQSPKKRRENFTRDKPSYSYVLCSSGNTLKRADSAPLAIALWRVRMWEGQGWEGEKGNFGGWEAN